MHSEGGDIDSRRQIAQRWMFMLPLRRADAPALVTDAMHVSRASGGVGIDDGREMEGHFYQFFRANAANMQLKSINIALDIYNIWIILGILSVYNVN